MVEKNLQSIFTKWVSENKDKINQSTTWELKLEKGTSFSFNRVAEHQIYNLLESKKSGLYHKISDSPIFKGMNSRFTKPKPLDCLFVKNADAYVVLCFYKPRQKKETLWIDIDRFIKVRDESPRKSIREVEARFIAERIEIM